MGKRIFATLHNIKCPYNCIYCFTKAKGYAQGLDIEDKCQQELCEWDGFDTIQPACDTELLLYKNWKALLLELVKLKKILVLQQKKK